MMDDNWNEKWAEECIRSSSAAKEDQNRGELKLMMMGDEGGRREKASKEGKEGLYEVD
jgi:hypothetical protein